VSTLNSQKSPKETTPGANGKIVSGKGRGPAGWWRKPLQALAALGPFALVFGTYSIAVDHLSDDWFAADWIRYTFAVFCALVVGLALRLLLQTGPAVRFLSAANTSATSLLPGPPAPAAQTIVPLPAMIDVVRQRLFKDYRVQRRNNVDVVGWSQFFGEDVPPSPIGSSYGLRIAMSLDIRDSRINRRSVVDSILSQQRPGGGWASSSQRDKGRPEVTAWVLAVLPAAGLDAKTLEQLVSALEGMLDQGEDPVGMNSVTVVTTVVIALATIAPQSAKLAELATLLADSAIPSPGNSESQAWAATLRNPQSHPSVPHTAQAVVALHHAADALPIQSISLRRRAAEGTTWLLENFDLAFDEEQIRRPHRGDVDALYVGHFTAAWVARALMLDGRHLTDPEPLTTAVRAILAHQEKGVWKWRDREPIWMAYQGISVLQRYILENLTSPLSPP
jgi:hypothetical protein